MSSADRFVALLVAILTGMSIIAAGIVWLGRMLWVIRGSWDETNAELRRLVDRVSHMDSRYERLETRVERHEQWHADRTHVAP